MKIQSLAVLALMSPGFAQLQAVQTARVEHPSPQAFSSSFGRASVLRGDLWVTSDPGFGWPFAQEGRVLVLERQGTDWVPQQSLTALDGGDLDRFGQALQWDGEQLLVGAPDRDFQGSAVGGIYVFEQGFTGFVETQLLLPSDAASGGDQRMGRRMALDGDLLAASVSLSGNPQGSSVLLFERDAQGTWQEVDRILPPSTDPEDAQGFGQSLALDGDTLVVGAPGTFFPSDPFVTGRVHVYRRGASGWALEDSLVPAGSQLGDGVGIGVDLQQNRLVIGAVSPGPDPGGAWMYQRIAGLWVLEQELTPPGLGPFDLYGFPVKIEGSLVLVGNTSSSAQQQGGGELYLYERSADAWFETARIAPGDLNPDDAFGSGVALQSTPAGPEMIVGAGVTGQQPEGFAYHFHLRGSTLGERFCHGSVEGLCPCGNPGQGVAGCGHSAGPGGRLTASGSLSVAADDLVLRATDLVPQQPLVLFASVSFGGPAPAGDGLACIGSGALRLATDSANVFGNARMGPGLGANAAWAAGQTWVLQAAFRDPQGSPCGTGFNWTSALALALQP